MGLTVCPRCAHTVRPAGPRWALWLALAVVLAAAALWGLGKLPVERVAQEVTTVRERLASLVQVLGPADTPTVSPTNTPQLVAQATPEPTPTIPAPTATEPPTPTPTPAEAVEEPTATPELTPTPEVAPTEEPTQTPTPTATQTPPPPATPTPGAAGRTTYRVKSGDTLSSIAAQFGISWEALAAANGLNSRSVLRIGQELVIPGAGAPPPPVASPTPAPAATPRPTATATAAPAPTPHLPAPVQINPGDGAPFTGPSDFELEWAPVLGVPPDAQYEVTIRWLDEIGAPQEEIVRVTANATKVRVPSWLWGKAYQPSGRRYTWTVRVVQVTTDGQGGVKAIPLSPASPARIFYWN